MRDLLTYLLTYVRTHLLTHLLTRLQGFTAMRDILEHVEQQPGTPPIVIIDADDLLYDPVSQSVSQSVILDADDLFYHPVSK